MQLIILVILWIGALLGLWLFLREFLWGQTLLSVEICPVKENDDGKAINYVLELLDEAEEKIELYDDGNCMETSLYNSEDFINAIKKKLADNPSFQVICLFNRDEPLAFKREFSAHEQVAIYVRTDSSRPDDMHYKIIDGKKAYLSSHKFNDLERDFRIVDGTRAPRWHQKRLEHYLFDRYRQNRNAFTSPSAC